MVKFDNRGKVKRRPNIGESQEVLKRKERGEELETKRAESEGT